MRALDEQLVGWTARTEDVPLRQLVAVPVDVGKSSVMVMACEFSGRTIMAAREFPLTRAGVEAMLAGLRAALPAQVRLVRVGVEAAGHYHQPMITPGVWPAGWQVVELNPGHVSAQRRVNGSRGVKTDRIDLTAIADLLLAGRGVPVIVGDAPLLELQAWVAHRARRVQVRTAAVHMGRPPSHAWARSTEPARPRRDPPAVAQGLTLRGARLVQAAAGRPVCAPRRLPVTVADRPQSLCSPSRRRGCSPSAVSRTARAAPA